MFPSNSASGRARPPLRVRPAHVLALLGAALVGGCGTTGPYVWVEAYKPPGGQVAPGYTIVVGDVLNVRVWNQEAMSTKAKVRPDGMISLPLVHDVEAAGLEPGALAKRLQGKLREFVVNPEVTVSLEDEAPFEVSVLGMVGKQGVVKLERNSFLVKAIAAAGGLNDLASKDGIYVLRYGDNAADARAPVRIRFKYDALVRAEGPAATFRLRPGDVVVVE
jgi:polysaccharide export outer membrane protein